MFLRPCSILKNEINMERSDLGAVLAVLTSQIDFLIMDYSNIALDIRKRSGPLCGALGAFVDQCTVAF
jgi:hypothetical protein